VQALPLFERLVDSFDALARSRGIGFQATLPTATIPARVDADQIEKVFANLLSNAFKFTPAGGRVVLTVETDRETVDAGVADESDMVDAGVADAGALVVTVEDDGAGIPATEQERIFERFHQVDDSSKRSHGGAGLGLALVKEVTELHGGTVELWSEPGTGSRFTVRIPGAGPGRTAVSPHLAEGSEPAVDTARAEDPAAQRFRPAAAEEVGSAPGRSASPSPAARTVSRDDVLPVMPCAHAWTMKISTWTGWPMPSP
jgi:signal transduction histidine kinase